MKGCSRLFETHYSSPSLIDIGALGNLRSFFNNTRFDASPIDTTNFQRDNFALAIPDFFKKPVRMLFTQHPANNAPCPVAMRQRQRHGLGAIFCNSIMIMLADGHRTCVFLSSASAARLIMIKAKSAGSRGCISRKSAN